MTAVQMEMLSRGDITPVDDIGGIYIVDVPYAAAVPLSEEQIIQEADPYAVFSHLTALAYHGMTDVIPKAIKVTYSSAPYSRRLPLGTSPEDWVDPEFPSHSRAASRRRPRRIGEIEVHWSSVKDSWDFGHMVGQNLGIPIYITDPERTLLDAIRSPGKCGGIAKVMQAWRQASSSLDLDRLIKYADRFDNQAQRQRVGFLLQSLGLSHERLDAWRSQLLRGGSLKLVAEAPYSGTFSPDWNISLNVPESVLSGLRDD